MYKRRPRVFFYDSTGHLAKQAVAMSRQEGARWVETRSLSGSLSSASTEELAWADLLVVLDQNLPTLVNLPPHLRLRHWPIVGDGADARTEIQRRIQGMLGGIRMFAASDEL